MTTTVLLIALLVHLALIPFVVYRVWRGENLPDRLVAADLVGILALAILVLMALLGRQPMYIDVALGLAALGFIVTILLAKFIADRDVS